MSNQIARNQFSNYAIEDNHLHVIDSLTRWDSAQNLDNSLAFIDDSGKLSCPSLELDTLLSVPSIETSSIINPGVDAVCIEEILKIEKQGSDAVMNLGAGCITNITDCFYTLGCKRDANFWMRADSDGATLNDSPMEVFSRLGDTKASMSCLGTGANPNYYIRTGSAVGDSPDICLQTGGSYIVDGNQPYFTGTTGLKVRGVDQNVEIRNTLLIDTIDELNPGAGVTINNFNFTAADPFNATNINVSDTLTTNIINPNTGAAVTMGVDDLVLNSSDNLIIEKNGFFSSILNMVSNTQALDHNAAASDYPVFGGNLKDSGIVMWDKLSGNGLQMWNRAGAPGLNTINESYFQLFKPTAGTMTGAKFSFRIGDEYTNSPSTAIPPNVEPILGDEIIKIDSTGLTFENGSSGLNWYEAGTTASGTFTGGTGWSVAGVITTFTRIGNIVIAKINSAVDTQTTDGTLDSPANYVPVQFRPSTKTNVSMTLYSDTDIGILQITTTGEFVIGKVQGAVDPAPLSAMGSGIRGWNDICVSWVV